MAMSGSRQQQGRLERAVACEPVSEITEVFEELFQSKVHEEPGVCESGCKSSPPVYLFVQKQIIRNRRRPSV